MRFLSWLFLAVLAALVPLPAEARPRDDATSGAYRCAVIGNARQWLDCFYGAVQPVRAQLDLPPAPAAQIALAASPPAGNIPPGDARIRDGVMSEVLRCYAITEDREWLDCYYGAAQPVRAELGLPPAPQTRSLPEQAGTVASAAGRPQAASQPEQSQPEQGQPSQPRSGGWLSGIFGGPGKVPEQQFGIPATPSVTARTVDHVSSRMASYSFDRYGSFTVTLANGQVWRQVSGDTAEAHWKKAAATYQVSINRGVWGSYNLRATDTPGMFKVDRVK